MAEGGNVKREVVALVLKTALGESASVTLEGETLTIVKDGIPAVYPLPEEVTRRTVQKFSYKYDVRLDLFWHPDRLQKGSAVRH